MKCLLDSLGYSIPVHFTYHSIFNLSLGSSKIWHDASKLSYKVYILQGILHQKPELKILLATDKRSCTL